MITNHYPLYRRRSLRLQGHDYAQAGAYFLTVCTHGKECLFGEPVDGQIRLSKYGEIVESVWNELPAHYSNIELDVFGITPNHVHGIVMLASDHVLVGAGLKPAPTAIELPKPTCCALPDSPGAH